MPNISEVPVLIVCGGAVGCVLSMELARRGVEYRCIDRNPGAGRETRAIAMHARTVEMLDLVDPELSRRILDRDLWCKGYVMHFLRDGERTEVRPGLDYTTVDSRYNCILAHNQSDRNVRARLHALPVWQDHRIRHGVSRPDVGGGRRHGPAHSCRSRRRGRACP